MTKNKGSVLDCADAELHERQSDQSNAQDVIGIGRSTRRTVDLNYESGVFAQLDSFHGLLDVRSLVELLVFPLT